MRYRTWAEISRRNLVHNFNIFRKIVGPKVKVCPVVKANAYGHGLKEVVGILDKAGAEWLGVDSLDEALLVRGQGYGKSILVLGYVPLTRLKEILDSKISLTVYNLVTLKKIVVLKPETPVKIHLKIETGLNRQGVKDKDLLKLAGYALKHPRELVIEGASTHFANIEDTLDPTFGRQQLTEFNRQVKLLKKLGVKPVLFHTAASAAAMIYPKTRFKMVRLGIGLYGLWPSRETKIACRGKKIKLLPVLSLRSIVAQVKSIGVGESVSYGRTWIARGKTKIAVIPVGYYDGFDRKLSNCGRVLVKGKSAPVIGRVAMNMIMVEVSAIPGVATEDRVTLIGRDGNSEVTADEIAEKLGTINYEVVTRLSPSLPRIIK